MPRALEIATGMWWRFERYEIWDGCIRPASGAKLKPYDPWDEYRKALGARKQVPTPYESLFSLLGHVEESVIGGAFASQHTDWDQYLTQEQKTQIIAWC